MSMFYNIENNSEERERKDYEKAFSVVANYYSELLKVLHYQLNDEAFVLLNRALDALKEFALKVKEGEDNSKRINEVHSKLLLILKEAG